MMVFLQLRRCRVLFLRVNYLPLYAHSLLHFDVFHRDNFSVELTALTHQLLYFGMRLESQLLQGRHRRGFWLFIVSLAIHFIV